MASPSAGGEGSGGIACSSAGGVGSGGAFLIASTAHGTSSGAALAKAWFSSGGRGRVGAGRGRRGVEGLRGDDLAAGSEDLRLELELARRLLAWTSEKLLMSSTSW